MEPKEYSWSWATDSRCLSRGPCELIFAYMVTEDATTDSVLYNGQNAEGDEIVELVLTNKDASYANIGGVPFAPPVPVHCEKGLYVKVGTNTVGIFVQWRNL